MRKKVERHLGNLLHVERAVRYFTVDVDTLRDGDWWLARQAEDDIRALMDEHGVSPRNYILGGRVFVAFRLPLALHDSLIPRLVAILARFRCGCAAWRVFKRAAKGSMGK